MKKLKLFLMTLVMFLSCSIVYTTKSTSNSSFNKKDYISYDEVTTNTLNLTISNCNFYCMLNNNQLSYEHKSNYIDDRYLYIIEASAIADINVEGDILRQKEVICTFEEDLAIDADSSPTILNNNKWVLCEISDCLTINSLETFTEGYSTYMFQFAGDKTPPTFSGTNNFVVNVNNMLTKEEIASHVYAYDETDGKVPVSIVSSTYDPSIKKKGVYDMVVQAKDSSNNAASLTIQIHVVDVDAPVITADRIRKRHNEIPTLENVLSSITVTDNYDSNVKLKVITDNFSNNGGKIGIYSVIVNATDSSGNVSPNKEVFIDIYDDTNPNIVVTGLTSTKELVVGNNAKLTLDDLKAKVKVTDDYLLGATRFDVIGYENYVKVYDRANTKTQITINAYDSSNNSAQLTFNIVVKDSIAPTFELDSYFVVLGSGVSLTDKQIKELAAKVAGVSAANIKDVTVSSTQDPNIKKAVITMNDDSVFEVNIESATMITKIIMKWYHYLYVWFTVLFNIDEYYQTQTFFDLKPRFKAIGEIYSNGIFYKR